MAPDGRAALWRLVAGKAGAIVPLNAIREGPPFYCVHSIGGEATSFRDLALRLGNEWPVCGIQVPKQHMNATFAASIAHMAQYYVEELTSFQPEGAFVLGGWSVGAVIAFEMAQQLRARGREVGLLVLFDGYLRNAGGEPGAWNPLCYWKWMSNLPRGIADELMRDGGRRSIARRIKGKLKAAWAKSAAPGGRARRSHAVDGLFDTTGWPEEYKSFIASLYDAVQTYVPKAYGGRVLLYAAKTRPLSQLSPVEAAWAKVSPALEIAHVDGTHLSLIHEPAVIALAGDLRKRLDELHGRAAVAAGPVKTTSREAMARIGQARIDPVPR